LALFGQKAPQKRTIAIELDMNWGISILDEAIDMPRTSSDPLAGMLMGLGQRGEKEKKEKEKGKKEKDKKSKGKLFAAVNIFPFF
jgi:hypothetical protein